MKRSWILAIAVGILILGFLFARFEFVMRVPKWHR